MEKINVVAEYFLLRKSADFNIGRANAFGRHRIISRPE
jgi:hypothetical protein